MNARAFALDNPSDRARPAAIAHRWTSAEIVGAVLTATIAIAILAAFYNRFWWAPDEGAFAFVADRLLNGAILNRDVQDLHGGYIHFVNAFALDVFGRDFLSLRYPLALLTVVQSCLVYWMLRPSLGAAAAVGGIAMAGLTLVQFINPTPNWYALFLTVLVIVVLASRTRLDVPRLVAVGVLLGAIFLFRQLSGVLVAIGTISYLLLRDQEPTTTGASRLLARLTAGTMAVGLAAYFWRKGDPSAFILYGACPLALVIAAAARPRLGNRRTATMLACLGAGGIFAALPLVLYHLASGSLEAWWSDAIISAVSLTDLDFFQQINDSTLLTLAIKTVTTFNQPVAVLNGLFWLVVLLSPLALGLGLINAIRRRESAVHPLPVLAVFYAIVSAHYAIPIYALYSVGLALAGILVIAKAPSARRAALTATALTIAVGLVFQAGQPLSRGLVGTFAGARANLDSSGLPGASIHMEQRDEALYRDLVAFIRSHATLDQPVLGMPMTPELYFLSERNPPVPFVIAPLALRSDEDVGRYWGELQSDMPAVVIFKPDDKYTTPRVRALMDRLRPHFKQCGALGGFELFAEDCANAR